jgi:hypothetical protein
VWKSIKYLYYKFYKLFVRINGKDDYPEYTAMLGVGTLIFFNLLSVYSILTVINPLIFFPDIPRAKFFLIVGVPYVLTLYFIFAFNGKYKRIINEFKDENESKKITGRKIAILYILASFFLVIFSLIHMIMKNESLI